MSKNYIQFKFCFLYLQKIIFMDSKEIVFLDAMSDMGFKKIFKTPEIMITFLNEILKTSGRKVVSVTYNDKESYSTESDKYVIFDVFCKSDDGSEFIIEMQKARQVFYKNRSLYYMSQAVTAQGINKSDWEYDLKTVYGIFFINFHLDRYSKPEDVVTEFALRDDYGNAFTEDFKMFFIDLLKFTKKEDECKDLRDCLIYVIKHLKDMKQMPFLSIDKVFEKLADVATYSKLTQEERFTYEQQLKHERDWNACLRTAQRDGIEVGEKKKSISIAKQMKSDGMPLDMIIKYTGLSAEEIDAL